MFNQIQNQPPMNDDIAFMIRKSIISELDAINQYQSYINSTTNPAFRKIMGSIRDEEKVHVGELFTLLFYMYPDDYKLFMEGKNETTQLLGQIGIDITKI